jgi:hypothetical protein
MKVLLMIALLASACGGSTPTAPSPPAPPPVHSTLVLDGTLRSDAVPPSYQDWSFRGSFRNTGTGCTTAVSGMAHLRNGAREIIASRAWTITPTIIVAPNDRVEFQGCCFSADELNRGGVFSLTFTSTEIKCP